MIIVTNLTQIASNRSGQVQAKILSDEKRLLCCKISLFEENLFERFKLCTIQLFKSLAITSLLSAENSKKINYILLN